MLYIPRRVGGAVYIDHEESGKRVTVFIREIKADGTVVLGLGGDPKAYTFVREEVDRGIGNNIRPDQR